VTAALVQAHIHPELYLEEARILAASGVVHAAIDLSDGLGSDLRHVCRASGVGALILESALPISEPLRALCRATGADPLGLALGGGEDYRLLITVDPAAVTELARRVGAATGRTLYDLGEIVSGGEVGLVRPDGSVGPLPAAGWDHFAAAPWAVAEHSDS